MFLKILQTYWKEIALLLVVCLGVWYVQHLRSTVERQAEAISTLEASVKVYKHNDEVMTNALESVKQSFKIIDEIDRKNKETFAQMEKVVNANNGKLAQQLRGMLSDKKPVTCDETIQYLIDAKGAYK